MRKGDTRMGRSCMRNKIIVDANQTQSDFRVNRTITVRSIFYNEDDEEKCEVARCAYICLRSRRGGRGLNSKVYFVKKKKKTTIVCRVCTYMQREFTEYRIQREWTLTDTNAQTDTVRESVPALHVALVSTLGVSTLLDICQTAVNSLRALVHIWLTK